MLRSLRKTLGLTSQKDMIAMRCNFLLAAALLFFHALSFEAVAQDAESQPKEDRDHEIEYLIATPSDIALIDEIASHYPWTDDNILYDHIAVSLSNLRRDPSSNSDEFTTLTVLMALDGVHPEDIGREIDRIPFSLLATKEASWTLSTLSMGATIRSNSSRQKKDTSEALAAKLADLYAAHQEDPDAHFLLRILFDIRRREATMVYSCRSACEARHLFHQLSATPSAISQDTLASLEEKMAGIPCSDCEDGVYQFQRRDRVGEFLRLYNEYFRKQDFIEKENVLWLQLQMSDQVVPYEFQDLLAELTLAHLDPIDPILIDRKMRELPIRVLVDRDLRIWMLGVPNPDRKWFIIRTRLVENLMLERFAASTDEKEAEELLELALRLAHFEGALHKDDREAACVAYCRAQEHLSLWRFDHEPRSNYIPKLEAKLAECGACD